MYQTELNISMVQFLKKYFQIFSGKILQLLFHQIDFFHTTRQSEIAVVRRLFKMGRQMAERRWKTLRRLFHPLPAEVWSVLKNSATLIQSATWQDAVDA